MFSFVIGFPRVLRPFADGAGEAAIRRCRFFRCFCVSHVIGSGLCDTAFCRLVECRFFDRFLFFLATGVVVVFLRGQYVISTWRFDCFLPLTYSYIPNVVRYP